MKQLPLWNEAENYIECIYYSGKRVIYRVPSPEWQAALADREDSRNVWCAGFVRREKYEEYQKRRRPDASTT